MSDTQAKTIRDLLLAALSQYDSNIDLTVGSRAYTQIITPIYEALSPDMFDTDLDEYLLAVLKEEYPSLELQDGDLIIDLLVKPLRLILEPLKVELNLLKKRQSVSYVDQLTMDDAEDLAANFFVSRQVGNRARGVVRILLSSPTFLSITDQVRFSTVDGLRFYPIRQEFINVETTALQQIGNLYYVDIGVIAELEGDEYNIPARAISVVEGIPNFVSATNTFSFEQGTHSETKQELLSRTQSSLTERSLTSRRGITARIRNEFDTIRSVSVVGYGDPEMERDILTGSGDGFLLASGISFIVGRYMFMITGFEDSKNGEQLPSPGDLVKLNFWKFMYTTSSVETNEIQQVIYSSYGDAPDMPSVHILLLKEDIERQPITGGYLPGVYLGVFSAIFSDPTITISGLPSGVTDPNEELPFRIKSNTVHIGGKYDVWVRPTNLDNSSSPISILKSAYIDDDLTVFFDGSGLSTLLDGKYPLNRAGLEYTLEVGTHTLNIGEPIHGQTSQSLGFILDIVGNKMHITARTGSFLQNEVIVGLFSNNTVSIQQIIYTEANNDYVGGVLTTTDPQSSYFIIDTYENYYILATEVEEQVNNVAAYIHRTTGVDNLFDPIFKVFPENADFSTKMQTFIGKDTVDLSVDITAEGVRVGDTVEILFGDDQGRYNLEEILAVSVNTSKVRLDFSASRTNSNVKFRVIREAAPIEAPLVRILPSGVTQTSGAGQGFEIPYKNPVGAFALGAFSGSIGKYEGLNGFVLPNMSSEFKGSGAGVSDLQNVADSAFLSLFSNAGVDDCISQGCDPCDAIKVTCSVTIDGNVDNYSAVHFYITGLLNSTARSYLTDFKDWLTQLITAFFKGQNTQNQDLFDDLISFVDMFAPISFEEPPMSENIIKQFEVCMPLELFDGCNNTYLAIPEFIWDSEFESVSTFADAISEFLSGRMKAKPTSLQNAKSGDSLKINSGANRGEYVIDKVINIPWYHGDTVSTENTVDEQGNSSVTASIVDNKAYDFTLVVIRGSFPNEALKGSSAYFSGTLPTVQSLLPTVPVATLNNIHTLDIATGVLQNPFDVIQEAYTVLFKTMFAQGFDLPETFDLAPGPVLTKIIQSVFSSYTIGNRSPQQTTRMLFQDAVDLTVFSAKTCSHISWNRENKTAPVIDAQSNVAPGATIPNLEGSTLTVYTTLNGFQDTNTLTGVVGPEASSATTLEEITNILQATLDPTISTIKVSYTLKSPLGYFIRIELLEGGAGAAIKPDHTSGLQYVGFTVEQIVTGSSTVSADVTTKKINSHNGSRFSITQGTTERSLIVDIQDNDDFYTSLLPRKSASLELTDSSLPRDSIFSAHYDLAQSCTVSFTNSDGESALEAGVVPGDLFYVNEQVCTLDNTGVVPNPFSSKKDRILHVIYKVGSKTIQLLDTAGTFLTPESTNASGESPEQDVVEVGDIIFFEAIDETARVSKVSATEITLDKDVSVPAQPTAIRQGKDGSITQASAEFRSITTYTFTTSDIGNYVVIYGSQNSGIDGTYTINNVTAGVATLSETFTTSESNLHWLIVKPTFNEIGDSSIDGFSDTIGVTPIRIYRGTPKVFTVGHINKFLSRDKSQIEILYGNVDGGPRRGVKQPFKVLRPSEYRMTAKQMQTQGTVTGFYYCDVPTTTLTPTFDLNIPENTQYTPVVSTIKTKGYTLKTKDRATVFSAREECSMIIDSSYIPKTLTGSLLNTQSPETATINIDYESSSEASALQAFLDSDLNKNLCADPLVRHYLPGYIYLEITGGSVNETASSAVIDYINSLSPTDSILLSDIEKRLHQSNVDKYNHPIFIHCLTHDLDRNIILTRVDNLVDDTTILHSGTNRITYFIATEKYIKVGETV